MDLEVVKSIFQQYVYTLNTMPTAVDAGILAFW